MAARRWYRVPLLAAVAACGGDALGVDEPAASQAPGNVLAVVSSVSTTCALTLDLQAYCWGDNGAGQGGSASTVDQLSPVRVMTSSRFVSIGMSGEAVCGLTTARAVECWGELPGVNTVSQTPVTHVASGNIASIAVGSDALCVLDDSGSARCLGSNVFGELGVGDNARRTTLTAVVGNRRYAAISTGLDHTCGTDSGGLTFCWGSNTVGQVGDATTTFRNVPTSVAGGTFFRSVATGVNHSCGISITSAAYCWGSNLAGEVGDGTRVSRVQPIPVGGDLRFEKIVTDGLFGGHTCGITNYRLLICWGRNNYSEITAQPTVCAPTTPQLKCVLTPTPVDGINNVIDVAVGTDHICAVTRDHQLYCWGGNTDGQLGDDTNTARARPTLIRIP